MYSSKMRRLCPYLAKGAARTEAATTMTTIPEAIKSCPYVKELYSGFETNETENVPQMNPPRSMIRSAFNNSSVKPKLFKMEEEISMCPCRDRYGVTDIPHEDCCNNKHIDSTNHQNIERNDVPKKIPLYDDK